MLPASFASSSSSSSRNTLRDSLAAVLGEVATDLNGATPNAPAALSLLQSLQRPPQPAAVSLPTSAAALSQSLGGFTPSPANNNNNNAAAVMLLQRLGLQQQQQQRALAPVPPPPSNTAPSQDVSLLDRVKASLIEEAIAKEKTRILQGMYLGMLQQKQQQPPKLTALPPPALPNTTNLAAAGAALHLPSPPPIKKTQPIISVLPAAATTPAKSSSSSDVSARRVADTIGAQLRAGRPYIDVTTLPGFEETGLVAPRNRGGVTESFPEKMHRMLKETAKDPELSSIVAFLPHGRAFLVYDIDEFVAKILPKYFKQSKWNSFARQLNLYGFLRVTQGPDAGAYYHELFLQGRPTLCLHMRRVGVPQQHTDRRKYKTKLPDTAPDFYALKPVTS